MKFPIIRNKQELSNGTFFNRLKPEDSELRLSDFKNHSPEYFYNKVRGLDSPYPNAYIKCKNGEKLYILKTKY